MASTRDRILDEALVLFAKQGVEATTITAIERAAGLAAGTGSMYRHFPHKDAIVTALIEREGERIAKVTADLPDAPPSLRGRDRLVYRYVQALDTLADLADFMAFVARDYGRIRPQLEDLLGSLGGPWDEIEHGDLEPGSVEPGDARATAQVVMAALVGYHLMETFFGRPPGNVDVPRFTAALAELVHPA